MTIDYLVNVYQNQPQANQKFKCIKRHKFLPTLHCDNEGIWCDLCSVTDPGVKPGL